MDRQPCQLCPDGRRIRHEHNLRISFGLNISAVLGGSLGEILERVWSQSLHRSPADVPMGTLT